MLPLSALCMHSFVHRRFYGAARRFKAWIWRFRERDGAEAAREIVSHAAPRSKALPCFILFDHD